MELIIGGAYQGKLTYAAEKYGLERSELFDLSNGFPDTPCACFYHLENLTKAASAEGISAEEIVLRLLPYIENAAVVSREIGCGIVSMDPAERLYREVHGSALQKLAARAESVTRVFCGIAVKLK